MLTDKAFEIFWKAYEESYQGARNEGKAITQPDLYKDALQAVIDAVINEQIKEQAEKYLKLNN